MEGAGKPRSGAGETERRANTAGEAGREAGGAALNDLRPEANAVAVSVRTPPDSQALSSPVSPTCPGPHDAVGQGHRQQTICPHGCIAAVATHRGLDSLVMRRSLLASYVQECGVRVSRR